MQQVDHLPLCILCLWPLASLLCNCLLHFYALSNVLLACQRVMLGRRLGFVWAGGCNSSA